MKSFLAIIIMSSAAMGLCGYMNWKTNMEYYSNISLLVAMENGD